VLVAWEEASVPVACAAVVMVLPAGSVVVTANGEPDAAAEPAPVVDAVIIAFWAVVG